MNERMSLNVARCCFLSFFALYLCESVASFLKTSVMNMAKSSANSELSLRPSSKIKARASPAVNRTSRWGDSNNSDNCSRDLKEFVEIRLIMIFLNVR